MTARGWRFVLAGAVVVAAIVAGAGYVVRAQAPGRIQLSPSDYDFGSISQAAPVSHAFEVRNVGRGRLDILGVSTSCGCTTAEIASRRLGPGQATVLTVTFDPPAHADTIGPLTRTIFIRSSDPQTPEARLTIRATVLAP